MGALPLEYFARNQCYAAQGNEKIIFADNMLIINRMEKTKSTKLDRNLIQIIGTPSEIQRHASFLQEIRAFIPDITKPSEFLDYQNMLVADIRRFFDNDDSENKDKELIKLSERPSVTEISAMIENRNISKKKTDCLLYILQAHHFAHFGTPFFTTEIKNSTIGITKMEKELFDLVLARYAPLNEKSLVQTAKQLYEKHHKTRYQIDYDDNSPLNIL